MNLNELPAGAPRDGKMYALIHQREDWADVLSAFGELDLSVAGDFEEAIASRLRGNRPLVVDFEFCNYIDSTILRVLVHTNRSARERFWVIVPPSARIHRIFELTRLNEALGILYSRDEARRLLTQSA
jgi:anti-anti-sigma factor